MKKHANISVFVPHLGCPVRCSFCNQHIITSVQKNATPDDVHSAVFECMQSKRYDPENTEIAFFGGSFTCIPDSVRMPLLEAAYEHISKGHASGIRISTRPDAINEDILKTLKKYGVTAIELGAQSLDDGVLLANKRGHTAQDVYTASKMIKKYGFELGLQMMTGLFKDTDRKAVNTARKIIKTAPQTVRIYPTLVLQDTYLYELMQKKEYVPQTLGDAVKLSAKLVLMFEKNNIDVIRVGLHTVDEKKFAGGPWHPAFGELCENEIYKILLKKQFKRKGEYTVFCAENAVSKVIGHHQSNIEFFKDSGYNYKVKSNSGLTDRQLIVEYDKR